MLDANELASFIGQIERHNVGVLYDTGNVAPLGYDSPSEIHSLNSLIKEVHIKDKDISGENVRLGTGLVDFRRISDVLNEIRYSNPIVFETVRGSDPMRMAKSNLEFASSHELL